MAPRINGPLYFEKIGRTGPVVAFVHPNPMDQSCWMYQTTHLSTWYQCVSIDIPGYGRSPKAEAGLTMDDMAQACWEAIDEAAPGGEPCILAGCSVGAQLAPYMYHQRPKQTSALVVCGAGYNPKKEHVPRRVAHYGERGLDFRWGHTFEDFSPAFRATPMARFFADMFCERNAHADVETIIHQFKAMGVTETEEFHSEIKCPMLILTGSEDGGHQRAFALQARVPECELRVLYGAGHACHIEQPWLFNQFMLEFLGRHGLFPGKLWKETQSTWS